MIEFNCYVTGRSFSETSSTCNSDIIRDNKKMESIPLESGKLNPGYRDDRQESGRRYPLEQPQATKSNPLYRDDYGDQRKGYQTDPEPRYQDHDRISRGSFNPLTSNDRLRTESSGNRQPVKHYNDSDPSFRDQRESENSYRPRGISSERNNRRVWPEEISRDRNNSNDRHYPKGRSEESSTGDDRYVYIEGDGGVRRLFKRVDDKDLGGEVCILSIQYSFKFYSHDIICQVSHLKGQKLVTTIINSHSRFTQSPSYTFQLQFRIVQVRPEIILLDYNIIRRERSTILHNLMCCK